VITATGALPALTAGTAARHWVFEPVLVGAAVLAAAGYLAGVHRVRTRGGRWPVARTATFLVAGLGGFVVTSMSVLGAYHGRLFWAYALRLGLLATVVPGLLAAGRPATLLRTAAGPRQSRFGASVWQTLSSPLVAPLVVPLMFTAVVFTPLLGATLRHDLLDQVVQLIVLVIGVAVLLPVVGDGVPSSSMSIGIGVLVGIVELIIDAIPGLLVRLRPEELASTYWGPIHRGWGPSPIRDQHLAGEVLWILAELIDVPFLAILAVRWVQADAREAAVIDRTLDEADAGGDQMMAPWWLSEGGDPRRRR
jgi:putative copper resistance protein D